MKKILFLVLLSVTFVTGFAQRLRINGYGGYMFDDGFESDYDPNTFLVGKVNGGNQWGAGLEYMMRPGYCFELQYLHQTTEVPYTYQLGMANPKKSENPTLTIDCIMVGSDGHRESSSGKVEGYAGLFLGSAHLRSSNSSTTGSWVADKFSFSARLGCNIWLLEKVGLKLQAQFLSIMRGNGNDRYTGTTANNYGLDSYSGIYQFGLGGGVTIKLGK